MKSKETIRHKLLRHALLLLAVCVTCPCYLKAEGPVVSLPSLRLTVNEAISLVESQAGLIIGVNHSNFDVGRYITVKSTSMSVDDLLERIVAGTGHKYIRKERHVVIVPEDKPAPVTKAPDIGTPPAREIPPPRIEEAVREMERIISVEETPEPETKVSKTVSYRNPSQKLSFSDGDPSEFTLLTGKQPVFALKTNIGHGLVTLTPNLGIELGVGRRTSIEISGGWNPWKLEGGGDDNKKLIHLYIQPEFRWWLGERFNGHFFGIHATGAAYNISQHKIPLIGFEKAYRYQGYAVGAGVSYGYVLMLSPVVNLEFTLGLGVWWLKYDRFECMRCTRIYDSFEKIRFAPTKAGISLSFIIK